MDVEIHGAKGGQKKPKMPYEAADSLRSTNLAKILIAVGEGEFEGTPTARDIYLDNTPIQDASGSYNFTNVKWEWRPGSVDQDYIPGIPSVENETSLNIELRSGAPWVQSISNTQLSAVRVRMAWPALQAQDNEATLTATESNTRSMWPPTVGPISKSWPRLWTARAPLATSALAELTCRLRRRAGRSGCVALPRTRTPTK